MPTTFLAVYRGQTVAEARLLAITTDPALVEYVLKRLLAEQREASADPPTRALEEGRRRALRAALIEREAER